MTNCKRTLAAAELLMIFPAVLFMTALFVRNLQPQQYEPAHTAQTIVMWYAARPHVGLWVLLIALPFSVLLIGGVTLLREWHANAGLRQATQELVAGTRTYLATILIAAATFVAGSILAIVALHVVTD